MNNTKQIIFLRFLSFQKIIRINQWIFNRIKEINKRINKERYKKKILINTLINKLKKIIKKFVVLEIGY